MIIQNVIGKPISLNLSKYLKEWTSGDDRATVSELSEVHVNTVKNVIYRKTSVTNDNSKVLVELLKTAQNNCKTKISESKKAKKEFDKYLLQNE